MLMLFDTLLQDYKTRPRNIALKNKRTDDEDVSASFSIYPDFSM